MKQRLIGGFFVTIVTLIIFLTGGYVTAGLLAVISLIGIYEILKVYAIEKSPLAVIDYIAVVAVYIMLYLGQSSLVMPLVIGIVMLQLAIYVILFPKYKDHEVQKAIFAFLYAGLLLSYVMQIRMLEAGMQLCFFILISSWGNDVFAYLVGSAIGKHKFSPKVSPNKSVEGFFGGILGAALLGFGYAVICKQWIPFSGPVCALIAAIGAIPAVIGDLAASAIKRDNGIKDYSKLIPGHGGIMDRIDSVLFTAPIIYYLIVLFNIV